MLKVAVCLPRGTRFSHNGATAIDLCVLDQCKAMAGSVDCLVIGQAIDDPFCEVPYHGIPDGLGKHQQINAFASAITDFGADIVVVHQHIPSALQIADAIGDIPVCLYRHGIPKASLWKRWIERQKYKRFNKTIWVSDFVRDRFSQLHPALTQNAVVIPNGLDLSLWKPNATREKSILFVGRANDEKGVIEAAQACALVLPSYPEWRAHFLLSTIDQNTECIRRVKEALQPVANQTIIEFDAPHSLVKKSFETVEIALTPSLCEESFGRTALEALAGGAALVSSRAGALPEVTKSAALYVDQVTPTEIAKRLNQLLESDAERNRLRHAGKLRANQYDISVSANKMVQMLHNMI